MKSLEARTPMSVDIGIPTYQRPHYIVEAIESVLQQSYEGWTLTISEDGPRNPAVADVVRPYLHDPRIRYRSLGQRVGAAANWNSIVGLGSAPYIALLHDDDRWHPDFLSRRIAFLEQHHECGLVFGRTREIDADGRTIGNYRYTFEEGVLLPDDLIPRMLRARGNLIGHPPSILFRRTAFDAAGGEFRDVAWEDYDMWFRMALKFPIGYLDVCDSDYRVHLESLTRQANDLRKEVRKQELQHAEERVEMVDAERPGLLNPRDRGELCADLALAIALDELEDDGVSSSARVVLYAIRRYPRAAIDRRVVAWALAVVLGPPGRRALEKLRSALGERRRRRWHSTTVFVSAARRPRAN